jgi:DNA invertase Pin-like site-specific DNA recombinase
VRTPKLRRPGSVWQQLEEPPAVSTDQPSSEILIGYARVSTRAQELQSQLDALAVAGCNRVFSEKISTRIKVRPQLEAAIALAREFKSVGQHVTIVVHELKRLGRGAAELAMTAELLKTEGIKLRLLTGLGAGTDSNIVFAIAAAMAESERDYIRDKTLEGQESARKNGRRGGRPAVADQDMQMMAERLHEEGVPIPEIASRLVIRSGKNKGMSPSARTVYRMLSDH